MLMIFCRASTVPHFTSGSLPSDYALVNHFHLSPAALDHPEIGPDGNPIEDTQEEDGIEGTSFGRRAHFTPGTSPTKRRTSFGYGAIPIGRRGSQGAGHRPSIGMPANPPEAEPLLGGMCVPRIEEECDAKEEDETDPSWTERIQEAKVCRVYIGLSEL
jgi:hypothetical protein